VSNEKKPGTGATNKRRKELAAAKLERQTARRAERAERHKRRTRIGWGIAALVGVLAVTAVVFWPETTSDDVAQPATSASASASPAPSASGDAGASASAAPSPVAVEGCDPAPTPPTDPQSWDKAPEMALTAGTEYQLTLATNCGEIVIDTFADKAPETVNAMLWLAGEGYFDSTLCHRLVTGGIKVLQCGDPTATGTGGPGFTIPDENLPKAGEKNYPAGTVAMANAGPGTSGSQFFLVYEDTTLPPNYTIWGEVSSGLDVVTKIAEAGVAGGGDDGSPAAPIGIETAAPKEA
jgi:peptidyl-prolyl cis-trans isomerase B (cyclophilin B)